MVIVLTRERQAFLLPDRSWKFALNLGQKYGWKPVGTVEPDDHSFSTEFTTASWEGNYEAPMRQGVVGPDGRNLASALDRALADVPEFDALGHKITVDPACPIIVQINPGARVSALEWFSGPNRQGLVALISFLAAGEFIISSSD